MIDLLAAAVIQSVGRKKKMENDFELFFKANEARIYYQLQRLGIRSEDYTEYYSEGIIALWNGYKNHNATKGNVGTYLNYQIRYRLIDLMRKKNREKELDEQGFLEQISQIDDGNRYGKTMEPIPCIKHIIIESEAFWNEVRKNLTEKQWKWVHYFIIADLSIKEIMEIEDVTQDTVKSWAKEVRKKLRHQEIRKKLEGLIG